MPIYRLKDTREKLYKEVYKKHSMKSKIAKAMFFQPIDTWYKNPYLKLKYYFIIELSALFSWVFCNLKINPNFISIAGVVLSFSAIFLLNSSSIELNMIALLIFFSKNVFDYTDGYVARAQNKTSKFGAFLDEWSGEFTTLCIYISIPIYVYNKLGSNLFLYICLALLFLEIINPKKKILTFKYLENIDTKYKNKILNLFENLSRIKNNSTKKTFKYWLFNLFANMEYTGRTRYTDFIVFVLGFELYFQKIILSDLMIIFWLLLSIFKFLLFFTKILNLRE